MKLTILSPEFPFSGRVPLVPPILEYLAALTYREIPTADLQLIDANQGEITAVDVAADIVAVSVMTATAPWAYRFADDCRKMGKRVILGGIHPSALPDEAALHADAVVVGEVESVWGRVLADIRNGKLETFYYGERQSLDNLPKPINAKLKGNYQFRAFFTMRGCPYRCTFCSVRRFYGDTIRYRPISNVVDEIETCAGKLWFNGDDNIWGGDIQRSINLFDALARGTKKHWYGFGDLRSIQSPDGAKMLASAVKSGLFSVWAGWEGDEQNLGAFNASGKQGLDREAAVKQMQDAGVDVTLFVVLGGRQDSIDSFKRTLELSERLQVGIHPVLLTPLPGTELYDEYRQYLLPDMGWESFTGVNAVFEHPDPSMSPVRREEEYHRLSHELFRFERIVNRIGKIASSGFPTSHIYSFMMQVPMKHALSKAYEEWKVGAGVLESIKHDEITLSETTPTLGILNTEMYTTETKVNNMGLWFWGAALVALSIADGLRIYYPDSSWIDALKIIMFLSTFMFIPGHVYLNRKRIYGKLDVLIDWNSDGKARKAFLTRLAFWSIVLMSGQIWGYHCTF